MNRQYKPQLMQSDAKQKEIINLRDGKRLGSIVDMEFDLETGRIVSLIVPGRTKMLGFLRSSGDIVIPWDRIKKIGDDVILVDIAIADSSENNAE